MTKILCLIAFMWCAVLASAEASETHTLDAFNKRFHLVKDANGHVTMVRMNMAQERFTITPYIKKIVATLKSEIRRAQNKNDWNQTLNELEEELLASSDKSQETIEKIRITRQALEEVKDINVDELFNEVNKHDVLASFEREMSSALALFDLSAIAHTDDNRYFFKRKITYEIVTRALNLAKKQFASVPVLGLVSTIIVKVHDMILDQRLFYQNMMLYYLHQFPESQLGLTKAEADHVFSSIYESRLAVIDFRSARAARENWDRFGTNLFFKTVRSANIVVRNLGEATNQAPARMSYAFAAMDVEGKKVVKHLLHKTHSFTGKLATAYYFDEPQKVARTRGLIQLAQLALGFVPVADFIKGQVDSFLDSMYVEQVRTEGALLGYLESTRQLAFAGEFKQSLWNPYL